MQAKDKVLSLLSLAQKAGKLISGEELCEKALRTKEAKMIIVCEDSSDNTKKKFSQKTFFYKTPFYIMLTKEELNNAIGKQNRATIAIIDTGFTKSIEENIKNIDKTD